MHAGLEKPAGGGGKNPDGRTPACPQGLRTEGRSQSHRDGISWVLGWKLATTAQPRSPAGG